MTMADHAAVTTEHLTSLSGQQTADPSATFVEKSHLAYMIPATTDLDLEEAFGNIESGESFLDSVQQRQSLFFDETVDVLLILKAPWLEQKTLQAQLDRLAIQVDAQIVDASTSGRNSPPSSDSIFSGAVPDTGDPFIVVDEEEEEGSDEEGEATAYVYAIWKLPVFLSRPRIRLQSPSVVFTASASLKPEAGQESTPAGGKSKGYLTSGTPAGFNVLEALGSDPALDGVKPRLSALRVSRVAPVTHQQEPQQHIHAVKQVKLPINAAIHTRIRFSRPNTAPMSSSLIALLEIDFTSHFDCEIRLEHITLSVPDTTVSCLNDGDQAMALPLPCVAHDHVTFLYHITPNNYDLGPKNSSRELNISIKAAAQLIPEKCTPKLSMAWTTSIDFTTPANPAFGAPPGTGIQRGHRPSQLSISGSQTLASLKSPSMTQPDALPGLGLSTRTAESTLPDLGITMSFTSAPGPIHVGDTFSWTIHLVNRAPAKDTRPPRKLALVAIPRRRRGDFRAVRPPSASGRNNVDKPDVADAVMDDNILHAIQKNATLELTEVVCLSADTRVGPLAPGSCHVADMQFLALREGVVGIEAIRVVDLSTQDHVDIRDLPTIIVKAATERNDEPHC